MTQSFDYLTEMITGDETHLDHMRIMKKTAVQKQARKRPIQRNLKKEKKNTYWSINQLS